MLPACAGGGKSRGALPSGGADADADDLAWSCGGRRLGRGESEHARRRRSTLSPLAGVVASQQPGKSPLKSLSTWCLGVVFRAKEAVEQLSLDGALSTEKSVRLVINLRHAHAGLTSTSTWKARTAPVLYSTSSTPLQVRHPNSLDLDAALLANQLRSLHPPWSIVHAQGTCVVVAPLAPHHHHHALLDRSLRWSPPSIPLIVTYSPYALLSPLHASGGRLTTLAGRSATQATCSRLLAAVRLQSTDSRRSSSDPRSQTHCGQTECQGDYDGSPCPPSQSGHIVSIHIHIHIHIYIHNHPSFCLLLASPIPLRSDDAPSLNAPASNKVSSPEEMIRAMIGPRSVPVGACRLLPCAFGASFSA